MFSNWTFYTSDNDSLPAGRALSNGTFYASDNDVLSNMTSYNGGDWLFENMPSEYTIMVVSILVPTIHLTVMAFGVLVNAYMVYVAVRYYRSRGASGKRSGTSVSSKTLCHFDYFYMLIGLCDIGTLSMTPLWIYQTITRGWVFGYILCKAMKGMITVSCFFSRDLQGGTGVHRVTM